MIVLAIDTETTGLIDSRLRRLERQPHVIEFAGILVNLKTKEVLEEYSTFIRPPKRTDLSEKITEITSITWDMLADAPPFSKVAGKIRSMIEKAPAVAAHNLSFDKAMIDIEFERLGQKVAWPSRLVCTVEQSIFLKGYQLDLSSLHLELMGYIFDDAHRAAVDTKALVDCLTAMHSKGMVA